jgi:hypothetical protein
MALLACHHLPIHAAGKTPMTGVFMQALAGFDALRGL